MKPNRLAVAVLLLIATACGGATSVAQATTPQLSVDYRGVGFRVPSSWVLTKVNTAYPQCPEAKLLSPAARSRNVRTALYGAAITLLPYRASGKCVDMRHVYQGGWRSVTSKYGLAMLVGPNPYITKSGKGLAAWEYGAIPSRNLGLQLFGFGSSVTSALSQDRAILATARAS
jgi:hypothetical protein